MDSLIANPEFRYKHNTWMKGNYNEPPIFNAGRETYRFVWSSSFDSAGVFRIENTKDSYKATIKLFGKDDTVGQYREFNISREVWDNITDKLEAMNFWTYPATDDRHVFDGATWILEAYKPKGDKCTQRKYHGVGRDTPIDTTFIAMCKLLYQLK